MIAVSGLIAVFASLVSIVVTGNTGGLLGLAVGAYLLTGLILQRREGQLSRKGDSRHYGYYYQGYSGSSPHLPDPTVTWDWRIWGHFVLVTLAGDGARR